MKINTA